MRATSCRLFFVLLLLAMSSFAEEPKPEANAKDPREVFAEAVEALPKYQPPKEELRGEVKSRGFAPINHLMIDWAESFRERYPDVHFEIAGPSSATAPPALIRGEAHIGPMGRPMNEEELAAFERKFEYKPTCIYVCVDSIAVLVNKVNPVEGLTLAQLDAIYSSNRKRGHSVGIVTWGQAGLKDDWKGRSIDVFGQNGASRTYHYFRAVVQKNSDFNDSVKELPGTASLVQTVAADRFAIGYSAIGYATPDVRAVPLAEADGGPFVEPTPENALAAVFGVEAISLPEAPDQTDKARVEALVKRLGDEDIAIREQAEKDLLALGMAALPHLLALSEGKDGEVATRAKRIAQRICYYPLARGMLIYVNKAPGQPLAPVVRAFLTFILSAEGQAIVVKAGYLPLTGPLVEQERKKLE